MRNRVYEFVEQLLKEECYVIDFLPTNRISVSINRVPDNTEKREIEIVWDQENENFSI